MGNYTTNKRGPKILDFLKLFDSNINILRKSNNIRSTGTEDHNLRIAILEPQKWKKYA